VRKIYLFFIFLFITGCGYNLISANKDTTINCPAILFGSDDKIYIGSSNVDISFENIEYRGEINNVVFSKKCIVKNNIFSSEISILFIVNPLVEEVNEIAMPFYVAILDQKKILQDILYFSALGQFKKEVQSNKLMESEIVKILPLQHKNINEESIIVIGYILDKKREKILN
jgi:hypothetical protein